MLVASHTQLGESANELVAKFGRSGYRYGFPDQYAYGPPVRPMNWDASRIYQGVIGRHYPDAQTMRYHSLYDPNMYMQPGVPAGFGAADVAMSPQQAIAVLQGLLSLAPSGYYGDYDVVIDGETASGAGIDGDNKLWVIHGGSVEQVRRAVAAAGGITATETPNADLAKRITNARRLTPSIVMGTLGKVNDVRAAVDNMIDILKSGEARPVPVTPIVAVAIVPKQFATPKQFAIAGATVGLAAFFAIGAVLLAR